MKNLDEVWDRFDTFAIRINQLNNDIKDLEEIIKKHRLDVYGKFFFPNILTRLDQIDEVMIKYEKEKFRAK